MLAYAIDMFPMQQTQGVVPGHFGFYIIKLRHYGTSLSRCSICSSFLTNLKCQE